MRRDRRPWVALAVVGLLVGILGPTAPAGARPTGDVDGGSRRAPASPDLASVQATRWIVQLDGGSLTQRARRSGRIAPSAKVDAGAASSQPLLAGMRVEQDQFRTRLAAAAPRARVERSYQVVLHGMAVAMSTAEAATVRGLPGVRAVTPDVAYHQDMYATPAQIGAPAAWAALGGQATAGTGVKVAIIDSGIFVTRSPGGTYAGNPCFSDAGYTAPPGYPRGDTRFTNNKVIVAKAYFRPGDPPAPGEETPLPGPGDNSHGSHVAGTVACNAGTQAVVQNTPVTLSGVAPHAYLMNYRVFYQSVSPEDFQNGNAYVAELVQAMEDAVSDGADVVSSSWGSSYQNTLSWPDPMVQAAEDAVDAGVTMVFAQGNEGPGQETGNLPGNSPKVIAVGAVTKSTTISPGRLAAKNAAGNPLPGSPFDVGSADFGPQDPASLGPAPYVAAQTVAVNGSALGCSDANGNSPFPAGSLTGRIAVIGRGVCNFSEKVFNAQVGGAVGAVVYNSAANGDNLQSMAAGGHAADITIPSFFLRRSDGLAMVAGAGGVASATYTRAPHAAPNVGDVMAGFSSRGPSSDKQIKPDLTAPGVDVVSAGYNGSAYPDKYTGFGSASGTSMATPHVAGAAALLKALHPAWTPAQVKSALMSTATEQVFLDTAHAVPAKVLDRGSGRIDLSQAITPGLTIDRPSISGGERKAGTSATATVRVTNVDTTSRTWTLAPSASAPLSVTLSGSQVTVAAGQTAAFDVTIGTPAGTGLGDQQGSVVLTNAALGKTLHIPVWLRVVPDAATTDVLLVDDDGSAADPAFKDYQATYKGMLDAAGVSYDTIEPWNDGFLSLSELEGYKSILLFTGDNTSWDTSGFTVEDHDTLLAYLNGGGRLLAAGQDLAEVTDDNTSYTSPRLGRSRLYHGYLGVEQDAPSAFPAGAPRPTARGTGFLSGLSFDLTPGGNAPGVATSIEATSPMPDTDTYSAARTVSTIVEPAPGGAVPAGAALGHTKSSEPSLEQERTELGYRSLSLGFGFEDVRSDTGAASAATLLGRSLDWTFDEVTAAINPGSFDSAQPVTLSGAGTSTRGTIVQYRWDFGDGTPPVTTSGPTAPHRFATGGTYPVRLEVTDSLGHRAVANRALAVGTGQGFRLIGADGGVFAFGGKTYAGGANLTHLSAPIVGGAPTPSGAGYWLVGADGGVFSFGDARFLGSLGSLHLTGRIVGMAATPSGQGYYLTSAGGTVYPFGDAAFRGSLGGQRLNAPIVGIATLPHGVGYWLVGADGGVFTFGDAGFGGSPVGLRLNRPVVGMAVSPSGGGYVLAASDGGVFPYGDMGFHGSAASLPLASPVVAVAPTPTGQGYWLAAADGGVFDFGDAAFLGSMSGRGLAAPIRSVIAG